MKSMKYATPTINPSTICHNCGSHKVQVVPAAQIYGRPHYKGNVYQCEDCKARVSQRDGRPAGRLADEQTRKLRQMAHSVMKLAYPGTANNPDARQTIYSAYAEKMGLPIEHCHIGYFSSKQCKQFIGLMAAKARQRGINVDLPQGVTL